MRCAFFVLLLSCLTCLSSAAEKLIITEAADNIFIFEEEGEEIFSTERAMTSSERSKSLSWPIIKENIFEGNPEIFDDNIISLHTPKRADDAAIVPITIQANIEQNDDFYIKKVYLVIDNNPSPVAGTFTMSKLNGLASLSTRVRVNAYSHVRAIAETSDGKLHMAVNFVKATGGCSAPAASDSEQVLKKRGKMKLRQKKNRDMVEIQFMISHPNNSGLQINQLSRHWIPADYVNDVRLTYNDEAVISYTAGISMSEDPMIRFNIKPEKNGELSAEVKDSQGRQFNQSWVINVK